MIVISANRGEPQVKDCLLRGEPARLAAKSRELREAVSWFEAVHGGMVAAFEA